MSNTIYHIHHIIPRHMGGTNDPSNLKKLTVKEHAEAHRKLYKKYGHWQDYLAWKGLSGRINKEELIREKLSFIHKGKIISDKQRREHSKRISGQGHPMYGKKHTAEAKDKMRKKAIGRRASTETRKKMSINNTLNNPNKKSICIDNVVYNSIKDAVETLGISYYMVKKKYASTK